MREPKILNKIFSSAPNYMLSFCFCLANTVLATLGGSTNWKWLIISDVNVAIWLLVAYWLDPNKREI